MICMYVCMYLCRVLIDGEGSEGIFKKEMRVCGGSH